VIFHFIDKRDKKIAIYLAKAHSFHKTYPAAKAAGNTFLIGYKLTAIYILHKIKKTKLN
jgi:hypothetical protein